MISGTPSTSGKPSLCVEPCPVGKNWNPPQRPPTPGRFLFCCSRLNHPSVTCCSCSLFCARRLACWGVASGCPFTQPMPNIADHPCCHSDRNFAGCWESTLRHFAPNCGGRERQDGKAVGCGFARQNHLIYANKRVIWQSIKF